MSFEKYLDIAPEVKEALSQGAPVVALESTIISHGMPYPDNVQTALAIENVIRQAGAIPATIAIIAGRLRIGLSAQEIEYMATADNVWKVSRRDFPPILQQRKDGATTVAGTMIIAAMAGIKVFVTGGVGGVHRDAGKTFDVSADLEELKNTDVAVVCAGCKSVLDISATLEYLETAGVPVITYGSDHFPAFYSRESGFPAQLRMDSAEQIAQTIKIKYDLGMKGGVLIACPVPKEHEVPYLTMEKAIQEALERCRTQNITGSKITPFLLESIKEITEGKSLKVNKELIMNNALLGARIAVELKK
ncbi:MAG: pseudouridine-5'-phosphate glycosidase [Clostridia bacterium]|nr:pseudouridine-5'-phosphate glycosidase [Clostridia bacterium]